MRQHYVQVQPRDTSAEPVCSLQQPAARDRLLTIDVLIQKALDIQPLRDGTEFRFEAPILGEIDTFIAEEAECCPFLAFERWLEDGKAVLRITQPALGRSDG
jgi:hypothetical protein